MDNILLRYPDSILNREVGYFRNKKITKGDTINLLEWLTQPCYLGTMDEIRSCDDDEKRSLLKGKLPCISVSGIFRTRNEQNLISHTKLISFDIDFKDNTHITNYSTLISQLSQVTNIAYCGRSVSGKGCWGIVPIAYPEKHLQHFLFLEEWFASFGIVIDPSGKDIPRLRFFSFDPDAYFNHGAEVLKKYKELKEEPKEQQQAKPFPNDPGRDRRLTERLCELIVLKKLDITGKRNQWLSIGAALVSGFKESGRDYFHTVSRYSSSYSKKEADDAYSNIIRTGPKSKFGSFIHFCKQAGIGIERTYIHHGDDFIFIEN